MTHQEINRYSRNQLIDNSFFPGGHLGPIIAMNLAYVLPSAEKNV